MSGHGRAHMTPKSAMRVLARQHGDRATTARLRPVINQTRQFLTRRNTAKPLQGRKLYRCRASYIMPMLLQ